MPTKFETINPYENLAATVSLGLADITTHITVPYDLEDLSSDTKSYVETAMGITPSNAESLELKSLIAFAANDYNTNHLEGYSPAQRAFIGELLNSIFNVGSDTDAMVICISQLEEGISLMNLTLEEQRPLLMGTAIGRAVIAFWATEIANPTSPWITNSYISGNLAIDTANIPYWTAAAMHGSFTGANKARVQSGIYDPSNQGSTPNIISVLMTSIGVGAGRVLYKWVPLSRRR